MTMRWIWLVPSKIWVIVDRLAVSAGRWWPVRPGVSTDPAPPRWGPGRDGRTEQDRAGLPKSAQEPGLLHDRDDRDATRVLHGELPDSDGLRQVVSTLISATPPLPQWHALYKRTADKRLRRHGPQVSISSLGSA